MYYNILKSKFTQLSTYPQSILVVLFIFTQISTYEQRDKGFWITSIKACFNDLYVAYQPHHEPCFYISFEIMENFLYLWKKQLAF